MKNPYPFTDTPVKREIAEASDHGQQTGDWHPLLNRMNLALQKDELDGPFFFHAQMKIYGKEAYNWCIVQIERDSQAWLRNHLANLGGYAVIQKRYVDFYGTQPHFPNHLPARILGANTDGNAGSSSNVSWFLEQYLPNIATHDLSWVCGLELISSWDARFDLIYNPAYELWLDDETIAALRALQGGLPLGAVATLAAIVHEAGHALGTQASIPALPRFTDHMSKIWFGALGELNTDVAALAFMSDILPPIVAFILLFRLAGNAGRGQATPEVVLKRLNKNYDCLASTILFERYRKAGVLTQRGDRWHIDLALVPEVSRQLLTDLESLGRELNSYVDANQVELIKPGAVEFFARDLPRDEQGQWLLPEAQHTVVQRLAHLPRSPSNVDMNKYYIHQNIIDAADWRS